MSSLRKMPKGVVPPAARPAARRIAGFVRAEHKVVYLAPRRKLSALAPSPLRYRTATLADLAHLGLEDGYDAESVTELSRRMRLGDRLVLGEAEGQLVFSGWISVGRMELPRALVEVGPHLAYAYKLFARGAYRRQGALRGFYAHVASSLLDGAVEGVLATVVVGNVASERAHAALEFAPVGTMWDLRVGPASVALCDAAVAACIGRRVAAGLR